MTTHPKPRGFSWLP